MKGQKTMRRLAVWLAVISVILAAGPLRIEAGLYSWDERHGGDYEPGLFWDPWDPPGFPDGPDPSDDVEFRLSDRYVVTFNSSPRNRTLSVLNGEVTFAAAGGSRWYRLTNGIAINSARLFLGGPGDMMHVDAGVSDVSLHSGGQLDIGSNGELLNKTGYIGEIAGPTSIVTVMGGSWTNHGGLYVGGSSSLPGGAGELNVSIGGTVNAFGTLKLWSGGLLDLSDGHVTATSFDNTVGGTFFFTGGQLTVDSGAFNPGTTTLILDGAGNPTLNLDNGAGASFTNDVTVGNSQNATLNANNGGQISNSTGYIGRQIGSIGTVTVQDACSSWTNSGSLYVGGSDTASGGAGELNVIDGSVDVTGTLKMWSGGSLNLSGGHVTTASLDNSAGGILAFTGGTLTVDGGTFDPGTPEPTLDGVGNPTLNLINGATASAANPLTVGNFENATLNVSSASQIDSDYSLIALQDGSAGAVTVNAATWTNGGSLTVGHLGDGELTITNGGLVTTMFSWIARNSDATGQVTVDGGTWTHSHSLVVGEEGDGSLIITNGGQVIDNSTEVGWLSGSTGEVTVDGGTWDNSSFMHIGYNGSGVVNIINGGQVTSIDSGIAWFAGSIGSVTVGGSGSSWTNTRDLFIGGRSGLAGGTGELTVSSGGTVNVTRNLKMWPGGTLHLTGGQVTTNSLDNSAGGTLDFTGGTLTIDGGTFDPGTPEPTLDGTGNPVLNLINGATVSAANPLTVGSLENATLNVNSASHVDSDYSLIGLHEGSTGTVTVNAATWTNGGSLTVGHLGDGELTITNGGLVTTMFSWLARNSDATGQVTVDGGTWTHSHSLVVGEEGDGSLIITNGGQVTDNFAEVGWLTGSVGEVTVDGSTWDNNSMHIGYDGNGVVNVINGGQVTSIDSGIAWFAGSTGSVTVGGQGSSWTNTRDLFIGGRSGSAGGTGELTVSSGGTVNVTRNLKMWPGGTLNVNGGSVSVGSIWSDGGAVNFTAGSVNCSGDLLIGPGGLPSTDLTLGALVTLSVDGATTIDFATTVTLNGGRFSTGSLVRYGAFAFNSGTFSLTDDDLTIGGDGLFGDTLEVGPGKTIDVTNTATVSPAGHLLVTGGSFGAGDLVNTGLVELDGATARIGGMALTNQGVLTGSGRIGAALGNTATGHVQIGAGQRMIFTGSGNNNAGSVDVIGGEAQFTGDLTNAASTGMIAGRDATLRLGGGLTNAGLVALSFGTSDVFGNISNEATGRIVISGGGNATFYDDLVNNGEVQVSAGSAAVYFGDVTGSGTFSGTGTNYFEGDLYPGSSPAELTFGGDVVFGPLAGLEMELAGTVEGDEHDSLDVAGDLTPGGALQVVLIDDFAPDVGDTFDIFDWGTLTGATFDEVELPELAGRKVWDISELYSEGEISVIGMLDGDTDVDWDVDSVDLANLTAVFGEAGDWHTDFNGDGRIDLTDFALMRANFGAGVATTPLADATTATPEPATMSLLAIGAVALIGRRRRRGR